VFDSIGRLWPAAPKKYGGLGAALGEWCAAQRKVDLPRPGPELPGPLVGHLSSFDRFGLAAQARKQRKDPSDEDGRPTRPETDLCQT
jgi:hypothetical protein